jgi:hypothetical protein
MWKPPLLKFNGVKEAIDLAKNAILISLMRESSFAQKKHTTTSGQLLRIWPGRRACRISGL